MRSIRVALMNNRRLKLHFFSKIFLVRSGFYDKNLYCRLH